MARDEIVRKFGGLAGVALPECSVERMIEFVDAVDELKDMQPLTALSRGGKAAP